MNYNLGAHVYQPMKQFQDALCEYFNAIEINIKFITFNRFF